MDMERIIGMLFSGFMCKIYACGMGLWMAYEAATFVSHTLGQVAKGFGG